MKIGALLVENGLITEKQLDDALRAQVIYGGRLGTNLVELGYLDDEALAYFLSEELKVPYAHPAALMEVEEKLVNLISKSVAERYKIIPFELKGKRLKVAMADPQDLDAINEIGFATGFIVDPMVAPEARLAEALKKHYGIESPKRLSVAMEPSKTFDRTTRSSASSVVDEREDTAEFLGLPSEETVDGGDAPADSIKKKVEKLKGKRRSILTGKSTAKSIFLSGSSVFDKLDAAEDRDAVADAMLDYVLNTHPAGAIFIAKAGRAEGWKAAGEGLSDELVRKIMIPLSVPGVFSEAYSSRFSVNRGEKRNPMDKMLRKLLRINDYYEISVTSIYYQKVVVCFLVVISDSGQVDDRLKEEFIEVAQKAGETFARLIVERRRKERNG